MILCVARNFELFCKALQESVTTDYLQSEIMHIAFRKFFSKTQISEIEFSRMMEKLQSWF